MIRLTATLLVSLVCFTCLSVVSGAQAAGPNASEDPWPFWGRTTTRLANTTTVGPQTPRIEWSIQFAFDNTESTIWASCVMDRAGRIFCGNIEGVTAIDSIERKFLWEAFGGDIVSDPPTVWNGYVLWGVTALNSSFYCTDAATGEEVWSMERPLGFLVSPVVDANGVVYFYDRDAEVYARNIADGSDVWTTDLDDLPNCSPALLPGELLVVGKDSDLAGLDDATGEVQWIFPTGLEIFGVPVIDGDRVYFGARDRYLYALDLATGKEIWRFWCEQINRGSIAIGHDGTIYTATTGNVGILFAVSPEGDELWRCELPGLVSKSPIVAGDGTIYVCSSEWTGAHWDGRVHAIGPDGTELWSRLMPDFTGASPMLAPDGTLYIVCSDKYLYAFKDNDGDLSGDDVVNATDLATLLGNWGPCPALPTTCPADLNGDGVVDAADLAILLGNWGPIRP